MNPEKKIRETSSAVPQELIDDYKRSIPVKIQTLQHLINNIQYSVNEEGLKALRMEVHRIRGSAGAYGFMRVTEICRSFEEELLKKIDNFKNFPCSQDDIANFDCYLKQITEAFSF